MVHHHPALVSRVLVSARGKVEVPFSRGSATLLRYETPGFASFHAITAAHVAQPHRFPHLFPKFGTQFGIMGDRHVRCAVLTHNEHGERRSNSLCRFRVQRHPLYDVSLLSLEDESTLPAHATIFPSDGIDIHPIGEGQDVEMFGFRVVDDQTADRQEENFKMVPAAIKAKCIAQYSHYTIGPLVIAKVIDGQNVDTGTSGAAVTNAAGKLVGIVVARVTMDDRAPTDGTLRVPTSDVPAEAGSWEGCVAFLHISNFIEFLKKAERSN